MKERSIRILLIFSLVLNVYLITNNEQDTPSVDKVSVKAAAVKVENSQIPNKRHENNIEFIEEEIMPEDEAQQDQIKHSRVIELDEPEQAANEFSEEAMKVAQKTWEREYRAFMERDLGLDPSVADIYRELADKRKKEIDDYLIPKMSSMEENEPYLFTLEDNIELSKINQKYLKNLKEVMGPKNYDSYSRFRENMNRKIMENGSSYFWVEF